MVLGATQQVPTCYYCNKPGHIKRNCYKFQNDVASGKVRGGKSGGRGGGRNGGHSLHNNSVGLNHMGLNTVPAVPSGMDM